MKQELWENGYVTLPRWTCPKCDRGILMMMSGFPIEHETEYSRLEQANNMDAEPDWRSRRFTAMIKCDVIHCGEVVVVSGNRTTWEGEDDEGNQVFQDVYKCLSVNPAPHIIPLSHKLPVKCRQHLTAAFGLYWYDMGATANRLRIVVERLMDHFNVPTQGMGTKTYVHDLNLFERITEFENMQPGHANVFNALRHVGNLGSHEGKGNATVILDCFELLEHVFSELIDQKSAAMSAKALNIIANKGQHSW